MEDIKAHSQATIDAIWNQKRLEVADEVLSADYVFHDPVLPAPLRGIEQYKQNVRSYFAAFPDLHFTIDHQVAEGETIVNRWTATGTHLGDLFGIPATGRKVTVTGMSCDRMENGKCVESWSQWDALGMMRQLGVVPGMREEQAA